jgi:hypothetical protein
VEVICYVARQLSHTPTISFHHVLGNLLSIQAWRRRQLSLPLGSRALQFYALCPYLSVFGNCCIFRHYCHLSMNSYLWLPTIGGCAYVHIVSNMKSLCSTPNWLEQLLNFYGTTICDPTYPYLWSYALHGSPAIIS